jgi:hypothetical protein
MDNCNLVCPYEVFEQNNMSVELTSGVSKDMIYGHGAMARCRGGVGGLE